VQAWGEADRPFDYARRELVALRPAGAAFRPAQVLYDGDSEERICEDSLAISDSGRAVVVFTVQADSPSGGGEPGTCRVYAAVRARGSFEFGAPVQLSHAGADSPRVALDAQGNGLVAWHDAAAGTVAVVRLPANGGFQPQQTLGIAGETVAKAALGGLQLRVSGRTGHALVAFPTVKQPGGFSTRVAAAVGTTVAGFGPAAVLSDEASLEGQPPYQRHFDAAAGADGTLAVCWRGGPKKRRVQIARAGPGAMTMSRHDTTTVSRLHAANLALSIADSGRVTLAWTRVVEHSRLAMEAASAARAKRFTKPRLLSKAVAPFTLPALAISSTGRAFLSWSDRAQSPTVHWSAARGAGFTRARRLSTGRGVQLYPGRGGAMLAAVEHDPGELDYWQLLTLGER
jgi:hypothetical protein